MKKLGKWWQWALLAAFAAALAFGAVQAKQVGDHLQYLVPRPPADGGQFRRGREQQDRAESADCRSGEGAGKRSR
ncbi:MAG: hypothetical protein ACLT74_00325 [Christensenellales bacterium]